MRLLKRTMRMFIVTLLAMVFAFSIAACKTRSGTQPSGDNGNNEGQIPDGSQGDGSGDGSGGGGNGGGNDFNPEDDESGIDWSKYWDGVNDTGSDADNFKFTASKEIGSVDVNPDDFEIGGATDSEAFTVAFNSDGGTSVASQSVESGGIAVKPATPEKSGYMFTGWTYSDSAYDFSTPVTANRTLKASWAQLDSGISSVKSYFESIAVEFSGTTSTAVQYRLSGTSDWTTVDANLVRSTGSNIRADIIGLKAGDYELKVGETTLPAPVTVEAYDRSGYAHFNYTSGVGAYKDDGTLKANALIIYVTEQNKNTVKTGYKADGTSVDLTPYLWQGKAGIGWLLNNRGYGSDTERANFGIQKLTTLYGAVVIRIIGKVNAEDASDGTKSLIDGLTVYNSTDNGGSVGDNGRMARIINAKNLTIEGIGEDACLYGWGVHFVANDYMNSYPGSGKSFEVRNLTFANYPEDAIGMEGVQGTSTSSPGGANATTNYLLSPVERCWIHNNVFLPGYCSSPAESDKKEGDGSCDFKRGQYYTLSYNYFEYCHKTNLIGSADASLTYNVTMHHNYWYNCGSRQPLARRANIHFYNNYIFGDANDSEASLSYVSSFRANCLVFSEANYFNGSKNVTQKKDGVGVAWQNIYFACSGENLYTELSSRTQTVTNSCAYIKMNIDYSKFYTNSSQFYYDSVNKVSKCLLDSAVGARVRVMQYAGVNGFGASPDETNMNQYATSSAVSVGSSGLTIDLEPIGKAKVATTVSNIYFAANNGWSSGLKIRGQGITFTLTVQTEVVVSTSSTGDLAPELIDANGKAWATKFTDTLTVVLPAGTYIICSGQKDKDSYITGLSFADTEASSEARVAAANSALAAIPSTITLNDYNTIHAAQLAYSALLSAERKEIQEDLYTRYLQAETVYAELQVDYVIARIDYIGTVEASSYNKITAAQSAYDELTAAQKGQVTNYSTLTAAWAKYGEFAAQNVIDRLLDLPEVENIQKINSFELLDRAQKWFDAVNDAFEGLTSEEGQGQQGEVKADNDGKTYAKLTNGLEAIEIRRAELEKAAAQAEALEEFIAMLEEVTDVDSLSLSQCTAIVHLYNSLSEAKQAEYADNATYKAIEAKMEEAAKQTQICSFDGAPSNDMFAVSGNYYSSSMTIEGETYAKGLKMESSTSVTFITEAKMVLTLYLHSSCSGKVVEVDGVAYTATTVGDNVIIEIELEAGEHKISKGSKGTTNTYIYVAKLTPAN